MSTNPDQPPGSVFVVQHVAHEDEPNEDVKLIGVYSTRSAAEAAINRLVGQPGFSAEPHGFQVDEYRLDEDHWKEGFVTVYPGDV